MFTDTLKKAKRYSAVGVAVLLSCLLFAAGCSDDGKEDRKQAKYADIVTTHELASVQSDLVAEIVDSYLADANSASLQHLLEQLGLFIQHYSELIDHIDDYQSLVDDSASSAVMVARVLPLAATGLANVRMTSAVVSEPGLDANDIDDEDFDSLIMSLEMEGMSSLESQLIAAKKDLDEKNETIELLRSLIKAVQVLGSGERLVLTLPEEAKLAKSFPAVRDLMTIAYEDSRIKKMEALTQLQAAAGQTNSESQMSMIELQQLINEADERIDVITRMIKKSDDLREDIVRNIK